MLRQLVDVARGYLGARRQVARAALIGGIRGDEVLGEMIQYGREPVILVEPRQGACSELRV